MYGNNVGGPFIMPPNMIRGPVMMGTIPYGQTVGRGGLSAATRGISRGGILSGIKSINWGGMLGNASKALGVVNQAIPIVKEVGPMMNNMRSMLKIASVFKDETDNKQTTKKETIIASENNQDIKKEEISNSSITTKNTENRPNFFL